MSWVSNPDSALSGGWLTSAYPGLGILGADIPTTGDNGGSPVLNDGINPSSEYRWALVTPPASGTITLYEDLTFEHSGAADGIYSAVYRLWEDGVSQAEDIATITLQVGQSHTTISVTLGNIAGAVSSYPVPRTAISAALDNFAGSLDSYPSGTTITTISAVLDNIAGAIASKASPVTGISASLGDITGALTSRSVPATTITATLDHLTGAVSSYSSGVAITAISATLEDVLGGLSSSSGGFSGSLSDADIARIATAVIAALRAANPPVPVECDCPTATEVADAVWNKVLP